MVSEDVDVIGERTDGGLVLRVEGDGDAWMKTDAPVDAEP